MALTPNGIEFSELEGSPTIDITTDGTEAHREFWLPVYSTWQAFVAEIVGVWAVIGALANGTCQFNQPMPFPGFSNLVPTRVHVAPKNPSAIAPSTTASLLATNDYTGGAHVEVQYKSMYNTSQQRIDLPGVPNGTYLSYSCSLGANFVTVPGRTFQWMEAPDKPTEQTPAILDADSSPGVLVPTAEHTLTWDRVLVPPWGAMAAIRGKVNNAPFLSAPAGTVLFLGAELTRQFQFTNDGGFWRLEYKFSETSKSLNSGTQVGWNYCYRTSQLNGENWCLIGATPSEGATSGGNAALNDQAQLLEQIAISNQIEYEEQLEAHGPSSAQTQLAQAAAFNAQQNFEAARAAAEAASGGLYPPPYRSADFTQLFQMGGGLTCL